MRFIAFKSDLLNFGGANLESYVPTPIKPCDHCGHVWMKNFVLTCGHYICQGCATFTPETSEASCAICCSWIRVKHVHIHEEDVLSHLNVVCMCEKVLKMKDTAQHLRHCVASFPKLFNQTPDFELSATNQQLRHDGDTNKISGRMRSVGNLERAIEKVRVLLMEQKEIQNIQDVERENKGNFETLSLQIFAVKQALEELLKGQEKERNTTLACLESFKQDIQDLHRKCNEKPPLQSSIIKPISELGGRSSALVHFDKFDQTIKEYVTYAFSYETSEEFECPGLPWKVMALLSFREFNEENGEFYEGSFMGVEIYKPSSKTDASKLKKKMVVTLTSNGGENNITKELQVYTKSDSWWRLPNFISVRDLQKYSNDFYPKGVLCLRVKCVDL